MMEHGSADEHEDAAASMDTAIRGQRLGLNGWFAVMPTPAGRVRTSASAHAAAA